MTVCRAEDGPTLETARKALLSARYEAAAGAYRQVLQREPANGDPYYGAVRSLIGSARSQEAYALEEEAPRRCPQTAGAQTAAGYAACRKGELSKAEGFFRAALKLDGNHAGTLSGIALINAAVSRFKTALDLMLAAYRREPDDPVLIESLCEFPSRCRAYRGPGKRRRP